MSRPLPSPTPETRPFWDAAREGRLALPWCAACGRAHFYPRPFCPHCGGRALHWRDASGRGTVYTFTVNYRAAHEHFKSRLPYVVAAVDLEEGVRLLANLVECVPAAVRIGARVQLCLEQAGEGIVLPQFRLA